MTDGQTLLAVFAAFYLMECLWIMPAQAWLAAGRERVSRFLRPWDRFHVAGGSPVLLHPVPAPHVPAMPWLLVAEAAHLVLHRDDGTRESLDWTQIEPQASEKTLRLDASHTLRLPHAADATAWAELVTAWKALRPEQRRAAFLKHARQTLSLTEAAAQSAAAGKTRKLSMLGIVILWWCFVVIAPAYRMLGDSTRFFYALGMLPVLTFTQAFLFLRFIKTHRLGVSHRFWRALGIALLPHLSARAIDLVCDALPRKVLLHPLAWAEQPSKAAWLENARTFWRRAKYRPGWKTAAEPPADAQALETFFKAETIAPEDYDPSPALQAPAIAWCPCCHASFLKADLLCQDCGGVELKTAEATPS
jgi:hypothetical protein